MYGILEAIHFFIWDRQKKNRIPCVQNSTKLYAWKRDSIGEISYVDLLLLNHSPLVSDARMAKENPPDVPQLLTVCDICSMVEDIAGKSVTIAIYRARVASAFFLPFLRRMRYVPFQHAKDELYNLLSAHVRKRTSNMRTVGEKCIRTNSLEWDLLKRYWKSAEVYIQGADAFVDVYPLHLF